MKIALLLLLLAVASYASVTDHPVSPNSNIVCQAAAQNEAMAADGTFTTTLFATYVADTCECAFLAQLSADITCCTDETWAPVASEQAGACVCTFTAHRAIPANTFDFYACADTHI